MKLSVGLTSMEMIELLKKVSTLVLPSYNEGYNVCFRGNGMWKAIISSTVGAIPEVVTKDNGILIEAGDVQALANALIKCSMDTKMVQSMSKNNIQKIDENFSMKRMHIILAEYYSDVMQQAN